MNIKRIIKEYSSEIWNIGFIQNSLEGIMQGEDIKVKWMKHSCKESWFADPFILDITDSEIHVLAEEFYEPKQRGRITHLILDKDTLEMIQKKVILELMTHLSFPAIIRKGGKIFIYPENGESGTLNLYQYFPDNNKCIKVKTILKESVADAVITTIDGKDYLFCTKQPSPNGTILNIYQKNEDNAFVSKEDYVFDEHVARMAGDFFEFKGKLFRPTQECNIQYGHAVTIQEVIREKGGFLFREIRRMQSVHPQLTEGMHTFNVYKGMIVTDALGFHNIWLRHFLKRIGILH